MTAYLIRFLVGGAVVCLFAAIGDVTRPKSFAGVFGAAPSVALATLALTIHARGDRYVAIEARSMILGALAMAVFAYVCREWFWRGHQKVSTVTLISLAVWLAVSGMGGTILWWLQT